jgi:hypothetical protein
MTRTQGQGQRPWWEIHLRLDSSIPTVSLVLFTGAGVRFRVVVCTKGGGAWWTVQTLHALLETEVCCEITRPQIHDDCF